MSNPIPGLIADLEGTAGRLASMPTVVGVQVAGVDADGTVREAAAGLRDAELADEPVVTETRFRPGSITKLLTATMVLQCVDDGLLSLDDPVRRHVPSFRHEAVTVGHLLAHASGLDAGDVFVDTGDDDGAIARYVEGIVERDLLFEPGRWMSYCNGGFVLAGHVVELARGSTWDDVARSRVLEPLGMASTSFVTGRQADAPGRTGPAQARGHLTGPGGVLGVPAGTLADDPMCTRGLAPAGATLESTAGDLARLAAAHLGVGDAPAILSSSSAARMQDLWGRAPGGVTKMAGVGLGWQLWRGERADDPLRPRIGGANPGQSGVVALDPEGRTALVVLTNSDGGVNGVNLLLDGFAPAAVPDDEPPADDLSPYAGRYRSHALHVDVSVAEDGSGLRAVIGGIDEARIGAMRMPGVVGELTYALTPVDRTTWASPIGPIAFIDPDGAGRPQLLRWRMRAHRRVEATAVA